MISGQAAAAGVLRDYCGNILYAYAADIGNHEVAHAKFGIFIACQRGFKEISVGSD